MLSPVSLHLTLIDGLGEDMPGGGMLRMACEQLRARGAQLVTADDTTTEPALATLAQSLDEKSDPTRARLLLVAEPDYLHSLQGSADSFTPPTTGPAAHFRAILSRGPKQGLHCMLGANSLNAVSAILSPSREMRYFNHRVVQQMNEDESMNLFSSLLPARISQQTEHPFAALLVDQVQGIRAGTLFSSYAAHADLNASQDLPVLRALLLALGSKGQLNVS